MADVWLVTLGVLPVLAAMLAVVSRRGWSSRQTPADAFRLATGVAFAAWVDVSLGVLATVAAVGWWREQWQLAAGGTFVPLVAAAIWLGLAADRLAILVFLTLLLAVGLVQVNLALWQRRRGQPVSGTIGHRTGLGLFLAILAPLSFLTPLGPVFVALFGVGVALTSSLMASAAWAAGILIVAPSWWPWIVFLGAVGILSRILKRGGRWGGEATHWIGIRHWGDTGAARRATWRFALESVVRHTYLDLHSPLATSWAWLIGWGAGAFALHARRVDHGHREIFREAHNDYLEFLFEYGLVGVLAVGWWLWRFGRFELGDPVTGAAAALGVGALAQFPLRAAPTALLAFALVLLLMRRGAAWA